MNRHVFITLEWAISIYIWGVGGGGAGDKYNNIQGAKKPEQRPCLCHWTVV